MCASQALPRCGAAACPCSIAGPNSLLPAEPQAAGRPRKWGGGTRGYPRQRAAGQLIIRLLATTARLLPRPRGPCPAPAQPATALMPGHPQYKSPRLSARAGHHPGWWWPPRIHAPCPVDPSPGAPSPLDPSLPTPPCTAPYRTMAFSPISCLRADWHNEGAASRTKELEELGLMDG